MNNKEIRRSANGFELTGRYTTIQDILKIDGVSNKQLREETSEFIKDIFSEETPRAYTNLYKEMILNSVLEQEELNIKKEDIENKLRKNHSVQKIHEVTEDVTLAEMYDASREETYFQPVINNKIIDHIYDTKELAIIGALTYKYNVNKFAFEAIMAMFNIRDEE